MTELPIDQVAEGVLSPEELTAAMERVYLTSSHTHAQAVEASHEALRSALDAMERERAQDVRPREHAIATAQELRRELDAALAAERLAKRAHAVALRERDAAEREGDALRAALTEALQERDEALHALGIERKDWQPLRSLGTRPAVLASSPREATEPEPERYVDRDPRYDPAFTAELRRLSESVTEDRPCPEEHDPTCALRSRAEGDPLVCSCGGTGDHDAWHDREPIPADPYAEWRDHGDPVG